MHALFVACLFGGAVATALFAFLGIGGAGHLGHGHVGAAATHHGLSAPAAHHGMTGPAAHHALPGAHGHAGGHTQVSSAAQRGAGQGRGTSAPASRASWIGGAGWALSWVSPLTVAAAALWFGGAGLIFEGVSRPLALIFAIVAAILGAMLVRFAMAAFARASSPPLIAGAEGAVATVNVTIRPEAPGEIIVTLEGLHRSLPARSLDGITIPRGATVAVVRRERGFAYVTTLDPLDALTMSQEPGAVSHEP